MAAKLPLHYPVVAVSQSQTTHLFDSRYGTGQSVFDGILRAANVLVAGLDDRDRGLRLVWPRDRRPGPWTRR